MLRPRVPVAGLIRVLPRARIVTSFIPPRRFQSTEIPKIEAVKTPRKSVWRTVFRYSWRFVYLSTLGGIGFFVYRMACVVDWY
jgi:hypothetical protein